MPRDPRGRQVEKESLTLPVWDRFDAGTAETVARAVERGLPEPWKFARVAWHEMGDQKRHVAFFDWNGSEFALIPGGEVALGYDQKNPFHPTAEQQASWDSTRDEYSAPQLPEFLDQYFTPLRRRCFSPFLAETIPVGGYGVEDDPAGRDQFLSDGFRLPYSDEWEYLCGAGARTLWRWGNDTPAEGYPCDYGRYHHFDLPRQPNAFGLTFPSDGYHTEGVVEPSAGIVSRSGDGGSVTCGGAGFLLGWLILATSYGAMSHEPYFDLVRRVYPLPPEMLG